MNVEPGDDLAEDVAGADGVPLAPSVVEDAVAAVLPGNDDELTEGQRAAVRSVLDADTLVVMPTGSGKSAVYQLAGQLIPGPSLVVSPTIALQQDQLRTLERLPGGTAALSSASPTHRGSLAAYRDGGLEYLLVAPEQLVREDVRAALRDRPPSLVVVDEAHCVSAWADFRPDYLAVREVVEETGHPRILALSATASPGVREEIAERLGMVDTRVVVRGTDRPNISLDVRRHEDARAQDEAVLDGAGASEGSGLVYVATRRRAEALAAALGERGESVAAYHAGLATRRRREVLHGFLDGSIRVVVATNAFGLGIDKPDVRFVLHAYPPESVDAYWQEVGRGGRDGEPAAAVLHYRAADLGLARYRSAAGRLDPAVADTCQDLLRRGGPLTRDAIAGTTGVHPRAASRVLRLLADAGLVEPVSGGWRATALARRVTVTQALADRVAALAALARSRVELVRRYAETITCRRALLLELLGETDVPAWCGNCDTCWAREAAGEPAVPVEPIGGFTVGDRVEHRTFGEGSVQAFDEGNLVVLFPESGYRTLETETVVERDLLRRLPGEGPDEDRD